MSCQTRLYGLIPHDVQVPEFMAGAGHIKAAAHRRHLNALTFEIADDSIFQDFTGPEGFIEATLVPDLLCLSLDLGLGLGLVCFRVLLLLLSFCGVFVFACAVAFALGCFSWTVQNLKWYMSMLNNIWGFG